MAVGARDSPEGVPTGRRELLSGIVTLLLTDVEGSTRLWQNNPDAMSTALQRHDGLVRFAIEAHGGQVFKTMGDAFCSAFGEARDAVAAAVAVQRALADADWPADLPIKVRIALHAGELEQRDDDYFGPTFNRCARIESVAHGGQVLVSRTVRDLVGNRLAADCSLRDLGEHRLRDLERPANIFQLCHPDLEANFPPLRSLGSLPNNLPVHNDRFVGREREIREAKGRLSASRLLTLTGPGGSGKTRLAQQVAAEALDRYPGGVWFVDLSALSPDSSIVRTTATTLGLRELPGQSLEETLLDHLRDRCTLLLFDNCEHVIDGAARLIEQILRATKDTAVLATSQEVLNLSGEDVWPVAPLSMPEPAQAAALPLEQVTAFESVQLFADRATAVQAGFAVTGENVSAVVEICRRLDGIPLAIELAAVRVNVMKPAMIARRLDQRFRLLTGGRRTAEHRQRTLQAAVEWSHDLLDERERILFRRLSVFAGGWTLDAAEQVCADELEVESWEVLDLLSSLVGKSLVVVSPTGEPRQRLYESIRHYALERRREAGECEALLAKHAEHFFSLAAAAEPELIGARQAEWLERLDAEAENLRVAFEWSRTANRMDEGLAAAGGLWRYWYLRSRFSEGRDQIEGLLESRGDAEASELRAKALHGSGTLAIYQGEHASARTRLEEARRCWVTVGDAAGAANSLSNLASIAYLERDYEAARERYRESLAELRKTDDELSLAQVLCNLGLVVAELGNCEESLRDLEQSLALFRKHSDRARIASTVVHIASVCIATGDLAKARGLCEGSLDAFRELGHRKDEAETLRRLGQLHHLVRDFEPAREQYDESLRISHKIESREGIAEALRYLGQLELHVGRLDEARIRFEEARNLQEQIGDKRGMSDSLNGLGLIALEEGRMDVAEELLRQSLLIRREIRHRFMIVESLESFARLAHNKGRGMRALTLAAAADAARAESSTPRPPSLAARFDVDVGEARESLGAAEAGAARRAGRAMRLDEAVSFALEERGL